MDPNPMTGVPLKGGQFGHREKAMCHPRQRGKNAAASQGTPRLPAATEAIRGKDSSSGTSEGEWPCLHLNFGFLPPEL